MRDEDRVTRQVKKRVTDEQVLQPVRAPPGRAPSGRLHDAPQDSPMERWIWTHTHQPSALTGGQMLLQCELPTGQQDERPVAREYPHPKQTDTHVYK